MTFPPGIADVINWNSELPSDVLVVPSIVTTDSINFGVFPVFDGGGPSVTTVKATLVSFEGDGETFGTDEGNIAGILSDTRVSANSSSIGESSLWTLYDKTGGDVNGMMSEAGQYMMSVVPTDRYSQVWLQIFWSDGNIYDGIYNPTASFLVEAATRPYFI